ncbi:ATP-dependent DNA ligase [Candidatus Pacearchaeota archaeon]|nr:ATP-dependent DNA ligase [Candidatus Pacearchaeota archaeon]
MNYKKLAELYEEVSSTTKRLEKIDILSKFLKSLKKEDSNILYLIEGNIYPDYDERKTGISNQLAIKAISKATGTDSKKVVQEWKTVGDIGKVAEKLTKQKKQSTLHSHILTTEKVLENLRKLPELVGKGTVNKKLALITELLTSASPTEALYLVRTLIGDLRIGVQESTIKYGMLKAFFKNNKEYEDKIQRAIDNSNDLAIVFQIARKGKIKELEQIHLEVGKPIKAMLAQKAKDIEDAFKKLGKPMAIEYKYDGFRLLIHKANNKISLFTRSLENVTKQFPEVEEYIKKFIKGDSFILDSEAVGYDKKTKNYTDFQKISQRIRRKYHIEKLQKDLPVEINVFDVLSYNGKSQIDVPFKKRRKLIEKILTNHPYKLISSKHKITSSKKEVEEFYKKALKDKQEGIMMKNLEAEYKPGRRVGHMLKLKPETNELDLVITGGEWGAGKRAGWISSFILSCRKGNKYLEIGKVGTGILEKETENSKITFGNLTKLLKPLIIEEKGKSIKIKPKIVVTITYQDLQKSPNYESKWALRFPRITLLREDKPLSEIATLDEIEDDFKNSKHQNYRYG